MKRIMLDGGKWFNPDAAQMFQEDTYWNGNNHISVNTGSQWEHESLYHTKSGKWVLNHWSLYHTKSGKWVLNHWSQWQGSGESYTVIDAAEAITWLNKNKCLDEIGELPEDLQDRIHSGVAAQEV